MDPESTGVLGILEIGVSTTRLLHSLTAFKNPEDRGGKTNKPEEEEKKGLRKMEWQKSPQNHKPCYKRMPNNGERGGMEPNPTIALKLRNENGQNAARRSTTTRKPKKALVVDDFRGEASSHAETEESRKLWSKEKERGAERGNVEATMILKFL